jgi:hypothetical protein
MKKIIFFFLFGLILFSFTSTFTDAFAATIGDVITPKVERELANENNKIPGKAIVLVYSNTSWSGNISGGISGGSTKQGSGDAKYTVSCGDLGLAQGLIQKNAASGYVAVVIIQNGKILATESTNAAYGIAHAVADNCSNGFGGGCLIATATYGSELAPEVQKLRELRDNSLLQTESGTSFINLFNDVYYSFSPYIADYERENPIFKEMVKVAITPMITSLSILNYVEMDSEESVLGYGISLIVLNAMMYVGIPVLAIMRIRR